MNTPNMMPTAHQTRKLSALSMCSLKTVKRCYAGKPVREATAERIAQAARACGYPEPHAVIAPTSGCIGFGR